MTIYDSTISNFSTTPGQEIAIGGLGYNVQDAGKSYSLSEVDSQTARFEIQGGDHAWFDGSNVDRSELSGASTLFPVGTPININYQFMMEPGQTNAASWMVVGEIHNADTQLPNGWSSSPPIAIQLTNNDQLQVVARYAPTGVNPADSAGNDTVKVLWTDPTPIVRGQYYNISINANVQNNSSGALQVSIDGQQVVNYSGPLGYGLPTYWEEGLYRSTTNQDQAADYRNLTIATGADALAAASGSTTSSGSTTGSSSGSTSGSGTTMPVAPTLTVANNSLSVSPGGSVSLGLGVSVPNAGDNVTVNISGLPKYETITDKLDGKTFSGSSVTLTAAEVDSGLSLSSSYKGHGHPTATLTVTATDNTGMPVTSAAQTITVVDPPATTTSSGSSTITSPPVSTTTSTAPSGQLPTSRTNIAQWFSDHPGFTPAATTLSEAGTSRSISVPSFATTTANPTPSASATAYALLNQMMARDFGGESHFAQAATASSPASQQQANLLTRPLH